MAQVGTTRKHGITGLPDELAEEILAIAKAYEDESRVERDEKRPLWLKLENYFNGIQNRFYDITAKDWRILPDTDVTETDRHYDKVINIFRAHGEAIIAALSVRMPSAIFYPEDADVIEDVQTARACIKIKELIERHNDAKLLLIKSLMILFCQGVVCAYIYNRKSASYGTFSRAQYGKNPIEVTTVNLNCQECGSNLDSIEFKGDEKKKVPDVSKTCPICGYEGTPVQEEVTEDRLQITGYSNEPKTRTKIDIFSPLYTHMPFYARNQELIPSLSLEFEQHYSLLKSLYPKLVKFGNITPGRMDPENERGVHLNKSNLVTTKCRWIRPWAYGITDSDRNNDLTERLRKRFPDGIYCVIIDDQLVECHNEALDDRWQISEHPLSNFIHAEPIGKPLAPIQDLQNEVTDLQIETFEHAIPETFADGQVLNFKKYKESKAAPGMMYQVKKPDDGQPIASGFHTLKTATLSEEAELFSRKLDEKGQFAVGAYPSIYGGGMTSGSKTAREYSESRAMALQRLSIQWNVIKFWWAKTMGKAVPLYISALKAQNEDEKFTIRNPKSPTNFVNQWVKQEELTGKIGRVEADSDEELPQTAGQLKELFVQLMTLKDETIGSAIFHPENTPLLKKALGAPEFHIPGSDSRDKQYSEISQMLQGIHIEVKDWEEHEVEAETCKSFLIGGTGLSLLDTNPQGRQAIEEHMMAHLEKMKPVEPTPKPNAQPPAPGAANPALGAAV